MNQQQSPHFFTFAGAIFGFLSVALGAFAAHGLEGSLSLRMLEAFNTAAHYQAIHALALLVVGQMQPGRWLTISGWSFILGILLFSGSLYVMTTSGIRALGIITPFGGTAFLIGWLALAIHAWKQWRHSQQRV